MEWDEIRCGMAIFAHPDDAEFGSAGTAARLVNDGKQFFYAVATDGSKGSADPAMTPTEMIEIRQREQRAAAQILGVQDVAFLGFEDGMLQPTLDLRRAITATIRRFKPDVVICQNPSRDLTMGIFAQHPDHLATGEATLSAVYPCARDRLTFPELLAKGLEPHAVKEVWVVGTSFPDHYVDITSVIDLKVQALQAHVSQVGGRPVHEFVPERARQLGSQQGMEYAEAYKKLELP